MSTHIGKILMDEQTLLALLDFPHGTIHDIKKSETLGEIEVTIIHPDMPEIEVSSLIPVVTPTYQIDWDAKRTYRIKEKYSGG
jgi:hypothetical protein